MIRFFRQVLLSLFFLMYCSIVVAYEYDLCIVAIFRDEAPYLKEWIEYHRKRGVEHFVLYNHFSKDNYNEVLKPYINIGLVDLFNWEQVAYPAAQISAYRHGIKIMKERTKWLALIDIDEFIVPVEEDDLRDFLYDYEPYAGLVINWQLFGTSNITSLPPGEWITKHLIYKFPTNYDNPNWSSNHFVKSIIRPDRIDENSNHPHCGAHVFMPLSEYEIVDSDEIIRQPSTKMPHVLVDKIRIHHYWFRTLDWFYNCKMGRRQSVGDTFTPEKLTKLFQDGQAEVDRTILRFVQ